MPCMTPMALSEGAMFSYCVAERLELVRPSRGKVEFDTGSTFPWLPCLGNMIAHPAFIATKWQSAAAYLASESTDTLRPRKL